MKVLILAAGDNERLGLPMPKCLLRLTNGQTLLEHNILKARKYFGEEKEYVDLNIGVVWGGKYDYELLLYLEKNFPNVKKFHQTSKDGTLGAIKTARDWIGEEDFLVLFADNYFGYQIPKINHAIPIVSFRYGLRYAAQKYAIILGHKIVEKPHNGIVFTDGAKYKCFCGYVYFPKYTMVCLNEFKKSDRGEYEIVDLINSFYDFGLIHLPGKFYDIATIEDYVEMYNEI